MKCYVCSLGPADGVTVYRQNPKGEKGLWACASHRVFPTQTDVQKTVDWLESGS